jgi:hypothetical protein
MKKASTAAARATKNFSLLKLTIGLNVGRDRPFHGTRFTLTTRTNSDYSRYFALTSTSRCSLNAVFNLATFPAASTVAKSFPST